MTTALLLGADWAGFTVLLGIATFDVADDAAFDAVTELGRVLLAAADDAAPDTVLDVPAAPASRAAGLHAASSRLATQTAPAAPSVTPPARRARMNPRLPDVRVRLIQAH